ncbi:caffeine resistance protein [Aspergillus luchuensis]|uniref:Caffeine resistance protein n=1 Tax=Aspergillus kawachii TaxID=1069201 RepID=A0A146F904_ASPKA|nr:caffeine resistance protein [Aspergillus luchuensis]
MVGPGGISCGVDGFSAFPAFHTPSHYQSEGTRLSVLSIKYALETICSPIIGTCAMELFRDTTFGKLIRVLTRGRVLPYPEETCPSA